MFAIFFLFVFGFVELFVFEKYFASKLASYKLVVCRRSVLAGLTWRRAV